MAKNKQKRKAEAMELANGFGEFLSSILANTPPSLVQPPAGPKPDDAIGFEITPNGPRWVTRAELLDAMAAILPPLAGGEPPAAPRDEKRDALEAAVEDAHDRVDAINSAANRILLDRAQKALDDYDETRLAKENAKREQQTFDEAFGKFAKTQGIERAPDAPITMSAGETKTMAGGIIPGVYSHPRYDALVTRTVARIHDLSKTKGGEYAGDVDRLAGFRRNAADTETIMEHVWRIYAGKHWDAITAYVNDLKAGRNRVRTEPISGRIDDLIVYLILLKAMVEERGN